MSTEQIYDNEISPLMAKIIAICQKHKIPALCTFELKDTDDRELSCTTVLEDETGVTPVKYRQALKLMYPNRSELGTRSPGIHLTVTEPDGSKTLIAVMP